MSLMRFEDKIFVAGHKGMVGNAIIRSLRRKNFSNVIYAKKSEVNLCDYNKLDKWFSVNEPNIVIIAAAKVGGIFANNSYPVDFLLENLKIQNNLIELAFKYKVHRLLFLGSSCIYPKNCPQPMKEEYLLTGALEETNNAYAIAKICGIKLCDAYRKQFGFDAISVMPTNLYGPSDNYHKDNSHVMPALIRKFYEAKINHEKNVSCWGSGEPMREFLHVDDLADACTFLLENWDPKSKKSPKDSYGNPLTYINIGTGKEIKIKELAELIANSIDFKGKIIWDKSKPDGTPRKLQDISKLKDLGWQPSINLDKGIKETIDSFISERNQGNLREV
tara:strand:+ start:319 stop:1317 length:999 start_codon:yes stop_codon:yes gene_type:complete